MKKILFSAMAVVLCLGLMGAAFAYFSDTETSSGNTFTAGTVDLETSDETSIELTNMKPGEEASGTITVTNIGTLPGCLYATSWYVTADLTPNPYLNMSDDDVAKMLEITAFTVTYDTGSPINILSQIPLVDGKRTVYSMVTDPSGVTLDGYPASPGETGKWFTYKADMAVDEIHIYALTVEFDTAAGNDYQGDGITLTFEFLLTQQ